MAGVIRMGGGSKMFSYFNRKTVLGVSLAISVINGGGF